MHLPRSKATKVQIPNTLSRRPTGKTPGPHSHAHIHSQEERQEIDKANLKARQVSWARD